VRSLSRPAALLWVALGGAAGTAVRYQGLVTSPLTGPATGPVTGRTVGPATGPLGGPSPQWPWAIFAVNLVGSFVLGLLLERLTRPGPPDAQLLRRERLRLLACTGFCGGLTTYSTLAVETAALLRAQRAGLAAGYLTASVVLGLLAAWLGVRLGGARPGQNVSGTT
jgi:protein CrcB